MPDLSNFASLDDLFLAGIVFDIAGAYILASGLLLSGEMIFRIDSTWEGVEKLSGEDRCRNRARGEFGFGLLACGFAFQAAGYALEVGAIPIQTAADRVLGAGLGMLLALVASISIWKTFGRKRERRLLADFAQRQSDQKLKAESEASGGTDS